MSTAAASLLAAQNDAFRRRLLAPTGGRTMMTAGVAALPADTIVAVWRAVAQFDAFTPDNDPYGEHDFGRFTVGDEAFFFKFDYYADDTLTYGADEPARACYRVLMIMFTREY